MKVIVAKPHPSVGKKNPSKNKVIPKDPGWSKKKGDDIIIQALGYGVDDCTRVLVKKTMF